MRRVLLVLVLLAAVSVALGLWLHAPRPAPTTSTAPHPERDVITTRPGNPDPSQTPVIPHDPNLDKNEGMGVLMRR
jgi:hypothetical protein